MAAKQIAELNRRVLLDQHMVPIPKRNSKNFFSLPNELFFLNIGLGAITVYAYLLYYENRRTHPCHSSCRTIAAAVHLSAATAMKHITKLADRQFITVENAPCAPLRGVVCPPSEMGSVLLPARDVGMDLGRF